MCALLSAINIATAGYGAWSGGINAFGTEMTTSGFKPERPFITVMLETFLGANIGVAANVT